MYCTCHGGEASGRDVFGLQRVLAAGRKPATPPGASRPVSRHRTGHRRITFGKPAGADYVGQESEDINLTVYTSNFGGTT